MNLSAAAARRMRIDVPTATRPSLTNVGDEFRSNLERDYAAYLEGLRVAGLIRAWTHEPRVLRLPGGPRYTPDFVVYHEDEAHLHEVKGYARQDDALKLAVAVGTFRDEYPRGYMVQRDPRGWRWREFRANDYDRAAKRSFPGIGKGVANG